MTNPIQSSATRRWGDLANRLKLFRSWAGYPLYLLLIGLYD